MDDRLYSTMPNSATIIPSINGEISNKRDENEFNSHCEFKEHLQRRELKSNQVIEVNL